METVSENMILSKETADRKLKRMALEVAERNYQARSLFLIGIKENGKFIARKIAGFLKDIFKGEIIVLELEIDKKKPGKILLSKEIDFRNQNVLLVDDVVNSGRTLFCSLSFLAGQLPSQVQTLVLVERAHKQFPVAVDYAGISVSTTLQENIEVTVVGDEITGACLK